MLAYDVFSDNAFQATEITEAVGNIVYVPQMLNQMNLFEIEPLRTTTVGIYKKNETLALVPTTERGTQRVLPERDARSLIQLPTLNLRQEDRIDSGEIQNIVQEFMPFDQALMNAMDEVDNRQRKLMRKLELTREFHRMAALQGILLDADGSVIMNFFQQFGFTQPAPIVFNFSTMDEGALRAYVASQVFRPMMRQLNSRKTPQTRIGAFCGDNFYDKLTSAPEIRKTYLNQQEAADLRGTVGRVWGTFQFADVSWINFQGTDDNTTIAIAPNECKFFPIGATDVYKEFRSPGEEWRQVNQLGQEFYSYVIPDVRAPIYMDHVNIYLDAHPLFACIAPDVLLRAILAS